MIIKFEKLKKEKIEFLDKIFIYPTDTIYGIGCDAENCFLVDKIRKIKKRDSKPFSVIAPNIEWILKNCETNEEEIKKFLPGPYTLILKKKDKNFLKNVSDNEFLGIRIPLHPMTDFLQKTGKPIVTTSVNFSGEPPMIELKGLPKEIKKQIDFAIDMGLISGTPSRLVKNGEILERAN